MGYLVVGVDPGPTPGICGLLYNPPQTEPLAHSARNLTDFRVMQVNARGCLGAVAWLLNSEWGDGHHVFLQVERFVVGRASLVSAQGDAGQITRDMVGALLALHEDQGRVKVVARTAAEVKPWATDERLKKAGLLGAVLGMPHARDAVRHALYCTVKTLGLHDPLSTKPTTGPESYGVTP